LGGRTNRSVVRARSARRRHIAAAAAADAAAPSVTSPSVTSSQHHRAGRESQSERGKEREKLLDERTSERAKKTACWWAAEELACRRTAAAARTVAPPVDSPTVYRSPSHDSLNNRQASDEFVNWCRVSASEQQQDGRWIEYGARQGGLWRHFTSSPDRSTFLSRVAASTSASWELVWAQRASALDRVVTRLVTFHWRSASLEEERDIDAAAVTTTSSVDDGSRTERSNVVRYGREAQSILPLPRSGSSVYASLTDTRRL